MASNEVTKVNTPSWRLLGYLGLIPFVALFVINLFEINVPAIEAKKCFTYYSAVILSFLAGTIWKPTADNSTTKQNIISNLFSLLAFFSLVIEHNIALILLAIGYLWLYGYERTYLQLDNKLTPYYQMRLKLTLLVFSLHALIFIF
jgi:hypothetical protein